ncbi:MAG: class I SAM-dependent methyltransferase [Chromatiaceae bacterium]|nr:class I SAM-dependent methyltransferase [Chromatiaceae bacterium]MCP5313798.1 class I SAM-dependent methyltransferase [Chromatiaceae bacterium]
MKFEQLAPQVSTLQYSSNEQIHEIFEFVMTHRPSRILELGTAYGKATVTMAAALQELGAGSVDTVDLKAANERFYADSCSRHLEALGLSEFAEIHLENHSYNWFLKKRLEQQLDGDRIEPLYDFVFIDGSHNFTVDGLAFFLCTRLMKPNAWVLFDDLRYNYHTMNERSGISNQFSLDTYDPRSRVVRAPMGDDELKACHVGLIYELLVKTSPEFHNFRYSCDGNWGYAQKRAD